MLSKQKQSKIKRRKEKKMLKAFNLRFAGKEAKERVVRSTVKPISRSISNNFLRAKRKKTETKKKKN